MGSAKFYSTKLVTAWPEYHVQQGPGWRLTYQDGYSSWCPDAVFLRDYQPVTAMSFGHAIAALKAGERVARAGWNGKGMWLALTPGSAINANHARSGAVLARATEDTSLAEITILPHIDMRAADGSIVIGWLASQTDMLADDWQVVS